jgi:RNA polymerase sigma factor (sigma-70 family)
MSSLLQGVPSDEQLTTAVSAGDSDAFEELYRRYAGPLAAYGSRVLRDRSRGEDVAQTSLMRAYDALQRGTEPLRVKPWLYKIALNTALELKAKHGDVLDGDSADRPDTSDDFRDARADILAGVERLPERQQKVFVLREIHGLPVSEVATRLDLTSQQVEQALFAARNRLAESLVFGERIACETIRSLDRSQLTHYERRAVKSHVRACPSCRRSAPFGLSSILFWLRDGWAWLAGGASASAVKVGAITVAAGLVGGAPVVASQLAGRLDHARAEVRSAAFDHVGPALLGRVARLVDGLGPVGVQALPLSSPTSAEAAVPPLSEPPAGEQLALSAPGGDESSSVPDRGESSSSRGEPPPDQVPVDPAPAVPADAPPADVPPDAAPPDPGAPGDTVPGDAAPDGAQPDPPPAP